MVWEQALCDFCSFERAKESTPGELEKRAYSAVATWGRLSSDITYGWLTVLLSLRCPSWPAAESACSGHSAVGVSGFRSRLSPSCSPVCFCHTESGTVLFGAYIFRVVTCSWGVDPFIITECPSLSLIIFLLWGLTCLKVIQVLWLSVSASTIFLSPSLSFNSQESLCSQ